ncbi:MAG: LPS export ABC transporter periplasmic protein LptC [Betaproteobacteria bacterium]
MKLRPLQLDRFIGWSPVLLLGAFAALTYWLDAQVQVGNRKFDGSNRHDPDIYIENFRAVSLDAQGRVRQSLTAKSARHFPDDDTTDLQGPQIIFSDPDKPHLTVSSERATITGDREHAYFTGNVKGVREAAPADAKNGAITLTSEFLHVIPKEDRVVTDKPVTIQDERGIISATGMEFDNRSKKIKFGSRVHGQMLPQK